MIIDVNACLGHYPFRRVRPHTAETMLALMDRHGIGRAVVSSLHAAFYRDAHRGNEELFAETRAHGSRFIPIATINPAYAGWERDFTEAVERWQAKAVALVPEHHGYRLDDQRGRSALARISERRLPVVLMQRFEDRRQRHRWDQAEDLQVEAAVEAARVHPELKFLLVNWAGLDGRRLVEAGLKGRCLIDFARLQVVYRSDVPKLIDALGVEAIAFGSHLPFDYISPSLVKLDNIQLLRPADYEAIAWRNAARFLSIEV
jgi:uncharacterized protein